MNRDRLLQTSLILSTLAASWLWMMIVHEFGHVLLAWACAEKVSKVVLHPLAISRTDTSHDNHPLLVIWAGPVLGSLIPMVGFLAAKLAQFRLAFLLQFFAGFCLIANGAYIGVGSFSRIGDAGDLASAGCPQVLMIAFGLACAPLGVWLWNGLGPHFGLNPNNGKVDRTAALTMLALLLLTVLAECLGSSR
jgi:hypothetical protein